MKASESKSELKLLVGLLLGALAVRIVVALVFPMGARYDLVSYDLVSDAVLAGKNVYVVLPERYPYFPGWMLIEAGCKIISRHTPIPFWFAIRMPQIIADVALVYVVYDGLHSSLDDHNISPISAAAVHAFNPVSIAVIAGHGQFDSLPILCLVLAILFFRSGNVNISAVVLGIGIVLKPVPGFVGLLFLGRLKEHATRLRFFLLAGLPTAVLSLPFLIWNPVAYIQTALGYKSGSAISWLAILEYLAKALSLFASINISVPSPEIMSLTKYIFIVLLLILSIKYWGRGSDRENLFDMSLMVFLLFYVVSSAVAVQYTYWTMPLLLLAGIPNWYRVVHIVSSFAVAALWYTKAYAFESLHSVAGYAVMTVFLASIAVFLLTSLTGFYLIYTKQLGNFEVKEVM